MIKVKLCGVGLIVALAFTAATVQAQKLSKVPVLSSISSSSATAGDSGFTLTVTGSNFVSGSAVRWNGASRTTTYISGTQLQATISSADITTAGTAQVTVFTGGRAGGESSPVAFTINEPAPTTTTTTTTTTTAPTTTTVSSPTISATSLAGGTGGTSYSATLQATGGTSPYTWGLVTGSGQLPGGLALLASGDIAGTPNQAGTFPFTVQMTDASGQVAQQNYSITIGSGAYLFQDGFESGTLAAWDYQTYSLAVRSETIGIRSGAYSLKLRYTLCGDSTNAACGAAHQDLNVYVEKNFNSANGFPNGLGNVFIRGYFKFVLNPGGTGLNIQRKLFYLKDPGLKSGSNDWHVVAGGYQNPLAWVVQVNGPDCGVPAQSWVFGSFTFDTWYAVELEVKANTPGSSDGEVRFWVNGTKLLERTGINMRGSCTTGLTRIAFGDQVDRFNYNIVDELRYWDDVVISTSYIGP